MLTFFGLVTQSSSHTNVCWSQGNIPCPLFSRVPITAADFAPKIDRRTRENYLRANRRRLITRASAGQKMQTVLGHQKGAVVMAPGVPCVVHNKFWPLWWRISFSIRLQTTLSHIRNFFHNTKDKERNLCQDLLTIENIDSDLEVHAPQHYANELLLRSRNFPFKNFCKLAQHAETIRKKKRLGKE